MAYFDYSQFRGRVQTALDQQGDQARKLVILHSGVVIGLGLLLSIFSYLLNMGIAETGGLSGIGTRTMLETAQTVLQTVHMVLLPFWAVGYTYTVFAMVRGETVSAGSLLWGLRHWGVVLRSFLLRGAIYVATLIVGAQLASLVYMLTPGAKALFALAEEMVASGVTDPYAMMESPAYQQIVLQMVPFAIGGMLLLAAPVFYRLRFTDYVLVGYPQSGALRAILASVRMTRKKSLAVLKLDLHFWWFYLAQALNMVLGYGDLLLPLVGIDLGISADVAMFVFYAAGLVCEFGLYVWRKNQVSGAYVLAYDQLLRDAMTPTQAEAKEVPWDE